MKEVKILFNGREMFSLRVPAEDSLFDVGQRAAAAMKVHPKTIKVGKGVVNLLTTHD